MRARHRGGVQANRALRTSLGIRAVMKGHPSKPGFADHVSSGRLSLPQEGADANARACRPFARAWVQGDAVQAEVERPSGSSRRTHERNPSLRLRRICLLALKGFAGVQCEEITGVYCRLQLSPPGILLSMPNQLGIASLPGSYTRRKGRRTSCKEDCT